MASKFFSFLLYPVGLLLTLAGMGEEGMSVSIRLTSLIYFPCFLCPEFSLICDLIS